MTRPPLVFGPLELAAVRVLLCDADGNLFPSEEPAFVASAEVTNRLLAELGVERRYEPDELRAIAVGRNFRATAVDLAVEHGVALDAELAAERPGARLAGAAEGAVLTAPELERWVEEERRAVTAHLGRVLAPDPEVRQPLELLARRLSLAVVSSSALARLDACFRATRLDDLLPPVVRFSAEDSLPAPASKPDPAVYAFAGERLGVAAHEAVAIEDAPSGVLSAVGAGFPVIGNVVYVAEGEREERIAALREAGAVAVVSSWWQLRELLEAESAAFAAR